MGAAAGVAVAVAAVGQCVCGTGRQVRAADRVRRVGAATVSRRQQTPVDAAAHQRHVLQARASALLLTPPGGHGAAED